MNKKQIADQVEEAVQSQPVIDTHEHLGSEQERIERRHGLLDTLHYVLCDLHAAGISREELLVVKDPDAPFEKRWRVFQQYWPLIEHTSYSRTFLLGLKLVHGVETLNNRNAVDVDQQIRLWPTPGCYEREFERAGIQCCMNDRNDMPVDGKLFYGSFNVADLIMNLPPAAVDYIAEIAGADIHTFTDFKRALSGVLVQRKKNHHMRAVKVSAAYLRTLDFGGEPPAVQSLETAFRAALDNTADEHQRHLLGNAVMHALCDICSELHLPVQIHTGLQAGGGRDPRWTHPMLLVDLFLRYPQTKFVLFHAAYPWGLEAGMLAKQYHNVYIDLAWTHIISPEATCRWLKEYIDILPASKVLGFGGDYFFIEGSAAHCAIARQNISSVLTENMAAGRMSKDQAVFYATRILHDNAMDLFSLPAS